LLARSLVHSGQRSEALKLLSELESDAARRYVPNAGLALVLGALGDKDRAFVWLEKDFAERAPRVPLFSVNPAFDDLRGDPRFQDLVRRVELARLD